MFAEHQQPHFGGKKVNGGADSYGDEKGLNDGSEGDGDDEIKVIKPSKNSLMIHGLSFCLSLPPFSGTT